MLLTFHVHKETDVPYRFLILHELSQLTLWNNLLFRLTCSFPLPTSIICMVLMVIIDRQDFENVLCVGLLHCVVTVSMMLMIHIRAVSSPPFMDLLRAVLTLPSSSPGRIAVHDCWLLSIMTHASSHSLPISNLFWNLDHFCLENGSDMFLKINGKVVSAHHTIQCHEAEDRIMKLSSHQCQVNLK